MRNIDFCQALNEATAQEMRRDSRVFVYGIGVSDHVRVFGSTNGLVEEFGSDRCFDTPLCEDTMTGFGLGAAACGLRPIHVHIRVDFLLLAMNQLVNQISSFCYGTKGRIGVPMVIRAVVGRGWGQGYQHSKSLFSYFTHIPGLKVVAPATPYDAKGLLTAAIQDNNPVVFLEHRWLYWGTGPVPDEPYIVPLGKANVLRHGSDLTIVATSWMNVEALHAARILERRGVSVEVIDPRTLAPLDVPTILQSVRKTGRCLVADCDWVDSGYSAEVAAVVSEGAFGELKGPVRRLGFAHTPCPTARCLEDEFYCNAADIVRTVDAMLDLSPTDLSGEDFYSHERRFRGPF